MKNSNIRVNNKKTGESDTFKGAISRKEGMIYIKDKGKTNWKGLSKNFEVMEIL